MEIEGKETQSPREGSRAKRLLCDPLLGWLGKENEDPFGMDKGREKGKRMHKEHNGRLGKWCGREGFKELLVIRM